jgi:ribonuclease HI
MKRAEKPFVEIYSDGACSGNPGLGGYGAILRSGGKEKELGGCEEMTTNNRMELLGAITALEALKKPCRVKLVTDSNYVVKGMNEWVGEWQKKNWKTSQKKDVLNRDLWERLLRASAPHDIEWQWIRGHDGHAENERCDRLAREEIARCRRDMKHEEA